MKHPALVYPHVDLDDRYYDGDNVLVHNKTEIHDIVRHPGHCKQHCERVEQYQWQRLVLLLSVQKCITIVERQAQLDQE